MAKKPTEKDILRLLDQCYAKCKEGIGHISPPVSVMAEDYLKKNRNPRKAAKSMLNYQIAKCTTSGFLTGFGGAITLPVAIPANIGSVLYVQMRMIACTAYMAGMDLNSDQVQTFVYACLAGVSVNAVTKRFGIKLGVKFAEKGIEKIPGKVLVKINQRVGFRLLTKFGEKGMINLAKLLPVVGAAINGGFDFVETKAIANRAYKLFIIGNDNDKKESSKEYDDVIDVEFTEFDDLDSDDETDNK